MTDNPLVESRLYPGACRYCSRCAYYGEQIRFVDGNIDDKKSKWYHPECSPVLKDVKERAKDGFWPDMIKKSYEFKWRSARDEE